MFDWKDSYSVGVPSIDREHQNLFKIAAELHSAMMAGKSKQLMGPLLDRLLQYTKIHFAHEERILEQFRYPDRVAHKAKHEELAQQVVDFKEDLEAGRITVTIKLLQFLKEWLVTHIQHSDALYTPYVTDRNVA